MPKSQYERAKKSMKDMERDQKRQADEKKRKKKRRPAVNRNQRKMLEEMERKGY
jgi:hypothetical protein